MIEDKESVLQDSRHARSQSCMTAGKESVLHDRRRGVSPA